MIPIGRLGRRSLLRPTTTAATSGIDALPTTDLPGWTLLLSEDFSRNATLGNFASVYAYDWAGYDGGYDTSRNLGRPSAKAGRYSTPYTTTVHDSMLDMRVFTSDGTQSSDIPAGQPLVAAPVPHIGEWAQLYGRYSVRFKTDAVEGYKIAWLLWPAQPNSWTSGEIDFPEGGLGEDITGFSHQVDGDPNVNQYQLQTGVSMTDWHVATIEWMPTRINFILDGVRVGTTTDPDAIPHVKMYWVLQTETWLSATPPPTNSTGHVYVDWVAAWSYAP
jgi:beta-glucanase (GH16 family)